MTMLYIKNLVWDSWNIKHISKHKVNKREIEEACKKPLRSFLSYKERLIVIGRTGTGRLLSTVLAGEENHNYYVVTARDTSKKERKLIYEKN